MSDLIHILKQYWGYDTFRPLQEEAMQCVLGGRDSLLVLPTGGGKSLCFQAPAVAMPGMAVVVSPLISLMKDQVDALTACGVSAARLNSMSTQEEKLSAGAAIREGRLKLLYVAPERLALPSFVEYLQRAEVSFFAVDEAHCISHWGHDFRPEYRDLSKLREAFPKAAIHAYTATATERVRKDIATQLGLRKPTVLLGSFFRPNLIYSVQPMRDRLSDVRAVIDRHKGESGIIYCISRKNVESLASELRSAGYSARPYHAGLDDDTRKGNQEAFIRERCDIIVATVAFGMGIDKSNVRYVIHAGMPQTIEHYLQESGRAGRDGLDAECVLLHASSDTFIWKKILGGGDAKREKVALAMLDEMSSYCHGSACRHRRLVEHFGQKFERASCDACDTCLGDVVLLPDALVTGQKILSCVVRLGAAPAPPDYVGRILKGVPAESLADEAHATLSTWGLLKDKPTSRILDWIEQLVERGYLAKDAANQSLSVTETGWRVLRGAETPRLSMPPAPPEKPAAVVAAGWEEVDRDLFEMLRVVRRSASEELNLPAFVVFSDACLREMARFRPSDMEGFLRLRGVGKAKAELHGERFLMLIADYCKAKGVAMDAWGDAPAKGGGAAAKAAKKVEAKAR